MADLRVSVSLASFRQPLKQALLSAARVGASGVQIDARNVLRPSELGDTGIRQLKKTLTDLNLRVSALRFPTRRGYDVLDDLDRRIDATKEAMQFAYRLGAGVVINAVGRVSADETQPGFDTLKSSLEDLAKHGQHVGAMLACETGSEPVADLAAMLTGLSEKAIGIAFNPGPLVINDYYESDVIRHCSEFVLAVVARDAVRDLALGRGLEVPLGQGSVDFPEILGVLEEQRYTGWFHLESRDSRDPVHELSNAISYLQAL